MHLPGIAARYRDHVTNTFKHSAARPERRYKEQRHVQVQDVAFIIFYKADRPQALKLERRVINELQAPLQDRVRLAACRPAKFRLWPRQRRNLSLHEEISLNFCNTKWRKENVQFDGIPEHVIRFEDLCSWLKKSYGHRERYILNKMYSIKHHTWLAFYLACLNSRLKYKKVWDSPRPRSLMFAVWNDAEKFPKKEKERIQGKVERFLGSST